MKTIYKALIGLVIVVALILVGIYFTHKELWWFSSGYSARQNVQSFWGDVNKGNMNRAYALSDTAYQTKNTFANFESQFNIYTGEKLSTSYIKYTKPTKNEVFIFGIVDNKSKNKTTDFAINTLGGKIDSIQAVTYTN